MGDAVVIVHTTGEDVCQIVRGSICDSTFHPFPSSVLEPIDIIGQEAQQIDVGNASIVDALLYDGDDVSLAHFNVGRFDQALASVSDFDLMRVLDW